MPELVAILEAKNLEDYENRKFFAALKGVDLDSSSSNSNNKWEELKSRVFSNGVTSDPNDVMALQGKNAQKKGFGIGLGLDAEIIDADGKVTTLG